MVQLEESVATTPTMAKSKTAKSAKKSPKVAEMKGIDAPEEEVEEQVATPSPKNTKSPKQKGKKAVKVEVKEENCESEEENLEAGEKEEAAEGEDSAEVKEEAEEEIVVKEKSSPKKKEADEEEESKIPSLYVRNVNFQTNYKTFMEYFRQFGTLKKTFLSSNRKNKGRNLGFGFVNFENEDDMNKALEAEHELEKMKLTVCIADKKEKSPKRKRGEGDDDGPEKKKPTFEHEVWVGRLNLTSTIETLKEHFSQFGEVINVTLPKKPGDDDNKGFAFVAFETAEAYTAAIACKDHSIDSRDVSVDSKKEPKKVERERPQHANELFIASLCKKTDKETLQKHFSQYGKISNITLPWYKQTSQNKGYMFLAYETAEGLQNVLAADHEVDGSKLFVKSGKNKKQIQSTKNTQKKEVKDESEEQEMEDESAEAEGEDNEEKMEEEGEGQNDDNNDEEDDE